MKTIHTSIVIIAIFLATIFVFSTVTNSAFAQAESMNQSMNDPGANSIQSTTDVDQKLNQTGEAMQGNASEAGENLTEGAKQLGANITEGAKDVVGSIGKGLENLGK